MLTILPPAPAYTVVASVTWYRPGHGVSSKCANGRSYYANLRHYGAICASRHGEFGDRVRLVHKGRAVWAYKVDMPDSRTDCDLDPVTFRRLAPLSVGRLNGVKLRVVGRAKQARAKRRGRG